MGSRIPIRVLTATIVTKPCDYPGCERQPHDIGVTEYRTASGELVETPVPGDAYIEPWSLRRQQTEGVHTCQWENCDGRHLMVCLPPDGFRWSVDGRASNCTLKEDRTHRCWQKEGELGSPSFTVGKSGPTCSAGAGSIAAPNYHGFLRNGHLEEC